MICVVLHVVRNWDQSLFYWPVNNVRIHHSLFVYSSSVHMLEICFLSFLPTQFSACFLSIREVSCLVLCPKIILVVMYFLCLSVTDQEFLVILCEITLYSNVFFYTCYSWIKKIQLNNSDDFHKQFTIFL